MQDILEDKARQSRSIYGSRGLPTTHDDKRHAGYSNSGRAEHSRQSLFELRRDIAQYRGATHPLCFTDEVMDHQIPEGFKPVNIESYDGATDHVDLKKIVFDPNRGVCCAIIRFNVNGFKPFGDLMIHYFICEA